jgi:hypothetical protein
MRIARGKHPTLQQCFPSPAPALQCAQSMAHPNFFAELKRRHVYKVAVAYVVIT